MSKSTFNVLRQLWAWFIRTKRRFAKYEEIKTHFQSVEVNMLFLMGYLVRHSDGVTATDKTTAMTSEDLYKINTI